MLPALSIRPYSPSDFESLFLLDQLCYPPHIAYSRRELRTYLRLSTSECLLAESAGELAGFILTHIYEPGSPHAHIITIDIPVAFRRRNIGTALLAAAESSLVQKSIDWVHLETATNNHAAVAFWQKHGYRQVGIDRHYYGRNEDAFLMHKQISPALPLT